MSPLSPEDFLAFAPNKARGEAVDQAVRDGLADSLSAIFAQAGAALGANPVEASRLVEQVRIAPISPSLMARYAELVEAIYADDEGRARALSSALLRQGERKAAVQILALTDDDLGSGGAERYARFAMAESGGITLCASPPEQMAQAAKLFDAAFALLSEAAPEAIGEVFALVRQFVLARNADGGTQEFDGASTFYLWGALFLNADRITDRVSLAVAIVHEAAHSFLFGVNGGARLTENPDTDLRPSPLRADRRPVEGVFHAVFVLARMIYVLDRLLVSPHLSAAEQKAARAALAQHERGFADGLKTLDDGVSLTVKGAILLEGARTYVASRRP